MAEKKNKVSKPKIVLKTESEERKKALDEAILNIEKQFGKGSLMRLGDRPSIECEVVKTGILPLDSALGVGGFPKGRIIEIFGSESTGKTTLALYGIAGAQKKGGTAAFVDAEHALDPQYAKLLGVNVEELLISQPDYGEEALEILEALVRSGAIDIIVVDSVAALLPKSEINSEMGESQIGSQARLMSVALRKLAGIISKSNTAVIFLNQLRQKLSMGYNGGGPSETTTGGNALKYYSSVRIEVRKGEMLRTSDADAEAESYGQKIKIKVVKNKVAPPFARAEFDLLYGEGISLEGALIDLGVKFNIIKKAGSWFSYNETKLGQGREKVRTLLKEDRELYKEIEEKIYKHIAENPKVNLQSASKNNEADKTDTDGSDTPPENNIDKLLNVD